MQQSIATVERMGDRHLTGQLRAFQQQQDDADAAAEAIDRNADDLYRERLASLHGFRTSSVAPDIRYSLLSDVLAELPDDRLEKLAKAIQQDDLIEAGHEIIKLVTGQLRKEAEEEAELGA